MTVYICKSHVGIHTLIKLTGHELHVAAYCHIVSPSARPGVIQEILCCLSTRFHAFLSFLEIPAHAGKCMTSTLTNTITKRFGLTHVYIHQFTQSFNVFCFTCHFAGTTPTSLGLIDPWDPIRQGATAGQHG